MGRYRGGWVFPGLAIGCAGAPAPAPSTGVVVAAEPAPSSTAAEPEGGDRSVAIVVLDGGGVVTSHWVERRGDGAEVLAEHEGAVVATDGGLLRITEVERRVPVCTGCNCQDACDGEETVTDIDLQPLAGSATVDVQLGPDLLGCDRTRSMVDRSFTVAGVFDRFVHLQVHTSAMACGAAHPWFDDSWAVVDLQTGRPATGLAPAAPREALDQAKAQLVERYDGCVSDEGDPAVFAWMPHYRGDGRLRSRFTITMDAPYVCGTGPGHYSVAATVDADVLPPSLESRRRLDDWLVRGLGALGVAREQLVVGVSRVPRAVATARTLRRFQADDG